MGAGAWTGCAMDDSRDTRDNVESRLSRTLASNAPLVAPTVQPSAHPMQAHLLSVDAAEDEGAATEDVPQAHPVHASRDVPQLHVEGRVGPAQPRDAVCKGAE